MLRSLRWRLQAWYSLVLIVIVAGLGSALYYRAESAQRRELESELEAGALYLDALLRRFPPHELDPQIPRPRRPEPSSGDGPGPPPGGPPGPPRPNRERLLAELDLPQRPAEFRAQGGVSETYFAVRRNDGSLLKSSALPEDLQSPAHTAALPLGLEVVRRAGYWELDMLGPFRSHILVGKPVRSEQAELRKLAWLLVGGGLAVVAAGLAGGWVVSGRILRPLNAIAKTASAISATHLTERIDIKLVDRELAGAAQALNATFDKLEAAFERQSRFAADAAHELRTPLTILRTEAELALSQARTQEEYREALGTCLQAVNRMAALVEGLLTLARAEGSKLSAERRTVDLRQLVEEGLEQIRLLAQKRGLVVTSRLRPVRVAGDPLRLAQVVTNLLSNAVHYNRAGGEIHVELTASATEAVLSVRDTGCGIPEEDRPHIFERFYRVDKARSRASGGNGLGLAICKSVVEAHGGTIGFESAVDVGSTFWVRLPRNPA